MLNVARDSMATTGYSPATRVFEAAGAGACLITDAWVGIELFLKPGEEVLVARDGRDVAEHMAGADAGARQADRRGRAAAHPGRSTPMRAAAPRSTRILREEVALKPQRSVA